MTTPVAQIAKSLYGNEDKKPVSERLRQRIEAFGQLANETGVALNVAREVQRGVTAVQNIMTTPEVKASVEAITALEAGNIFNINALIELVNDVKGNAYYGLNQNEYVRIKALVENANVPDFVKDVVIARLDFLVRDVDVDDAGDINNVVDSNEVAVFIEAAFDAYMVTNAIIVAAYQANATPDLLSEINEAAMNAVINEYDDLDVNNLMNLVVDAIEDLEDENENFIGGIINQVQQDLIDPITEFYNETPINDNARFALYAGNATKAVIAEVVTIEDIPNDIKQEAFNQINGTLDDATNNTIVSARNFGRQRILHAIAGIEPLETVVNNLAPNTNIDNIVNKVQGVGDDDSYDVREREQDADSANHAFESIKILLKNLKNVQPADATETARINALSATDLANECITALDNPNVKITKDNLKVLANILQINIGVLSNVPASPADHAELTFNEGGSNKYLSIFGQQEDIATVFYDVDDATGVIKKRDNNPFAYVQLKETLDPRNPDPINNQKAFLVLEHLVSSSGTATDIGRFVPIQDTNDLRILKTFFTGKGIPGLKAAIEGQQADPYNYIPPIELIQAAQYQFFLFKAVATPVNPEAIANHAKSILNAPTFSGAVNALTSDDGDQRELYSFLKNPGVGNLGNVTDFDTSANMRLNAWNNLRKATLIRLLEADSTYLPHLIRDNCSRAELKILQEALASPEDVDKQHAKNKILYKILRPYSVGMEDAVVDLPLKLDPNVSKFISPATIQRGIEKAYAKRSNFELDKTIKADENSDYGFLVAVVRSLEKTPGVLNAAKNRLGITDVELSFANVNALANDLIDQIADTNPNKALLINALKKQDIKRIENYIEKQKEVAKARFYRGEIEQVDLGRTLGELDALKANLIVQANSGNSYNARSIAQAGLTIENLNTISLENLKKLYKIALKDNQHITPEDVALLNTVLPNINIQVYKKGLPAQIGDISLNNINDTEPPVYKVADFWGTRVANGTSPHPVVNIYQDNNSWVALNDDVEKLIDLKAGKTVLTAEQYKELNILITDLEAVVATSTAGMLPLDAVNHPRGNLIHLSDVYQGVLKDIIDAQINTVGATQGPNFDPNNPDHLKLLHIAKTIHSRAVLHQLEAVANTVDAADFPLGMDALACFSGKIRHLNVAVTTQRANQNVQWGHDAELLGDARREYLLQTIDHNALLSIVKQGETVGANLATAPQDNWNAVKGHFASVTNAWKDTVLNAMDPPGSPATARQSFRRDALIRALEQDFTATIENLLGKPSTSSDLRDLNAILGYATKDLAHKQEAIARWLIYRFELGDIPNIAHVSNLLNAKKVEAFAQVVTEKQQAIQQVKDQEKNLHYREVKPADPANLNKPNNIVEVLYVAKNLKQPKSTTEIQPFIDGLVDNLGAKIGAGNPTRADIEARLTAFGETAPGGGWATQSERELAKRYIQTCLYEKATIQALDVTDQDLSILAKAMDSNTSLLHTQINVITKARTNASDLEIVSEDNHFFVKNDAYLAENTTRINIIRTSDTAFGFAFNPRAKGKLSNEQREALKVIADNNDVADFLGASKAKVVDLLPFGDKANPGNNEVFNHNIRNTARVEYLFENPELTPEDYKNIINSVLADPASQATLDAIKTMANKSSALDQTQVANWDNAGWVKSILDSTTIADTGGANDLHSDLVRAIQRTALRRYFELNQQEIIEKLWTVTDPDELKNLENYLNLDRATRGATSNSTLNRILTDFPGISTHHSEILNAFIDENRLFLAGTVNNIIEIRAKIESDLGKVPVDQALVMSSYEYQYKNVLSTPVTFDASNPKSYENLAQLVDRDVSDLTDDMITMVQKEVAIKLLNHEQFLLLAVKDFLLEELQKLQVLTDISNPTHKAKIIECLNRNVSKGNFNFTEANLSDAQTNKIMQWLPEIIREKEHNVRLLKVLSSTVLLNSQVSSRVSHALKGLDIAQLRIIQKILNEHSGKSLNIIFNQLVNDSNLQNPLLSLKTHTMDDEEKVQCVQLIQQEYGKYFAHAFFDGLKKSELLEVQNILEGSQNATDKINALNGLKKTSAGTPDYFTEKFDGTADLSLVTEGTLLNVTKANIAKYDHFLKAMEEISSGYSELASGKNSNEDGALKGFANAIINNKAYDQLPTEEQLHNLREAIQKPNMSQKNVIDALNALDDVSFFGTGTVNAVANQVVIRNNQLKIHRYQDIENPALAHALKRINNFIDGNVVEKNQRLDLNDSVIATINACLRELGTLDPKNAYDALDKLVAKLKEKGVELKRKNWISGGVFNTDADMLALLEPYKDAIIATHNQHVFVETWLSKEYEKTLAKEKEGQKNLNSAQKIQFAKKVYDFQQMKRMFNVLKTRSINFYSDETQTQEQNLKNIADCWELSCAFATDKDILSSGENNHKIDTEKAINEFNRLMVEKGFCSPYDSPVLNNEHDAQIIFSVDLSLNKQNELTGEEKSYDKSESMIHQELYDIQKTLMDDIQPFLRDPLSKETYDFFKNGMDKKTCLGALKGAGVGGTIGLGGVLGWGGLIAAGAIGGALTFGVVPLAILGTMAMYYLGAGAGTVVLGGGVIGGYLSSRSERIPNLTDMLKDIRDKMRKPSSNQEFADFALNMEAVVKQYLDDITAKLKDYPRIDKSLKKLEERYKKLEQEKIQNSQTKTLLKELKHQIETCKKQLLLTKEQEKQYISWQHDLKSTLNLIEEVRYKYKEEKTADGRIEKKFDTDSLGFKIPRKPDEAVESSLSQSLGISSYRKKLKKSVLDNVLGGFGKEDSIKTKSTLALSTETASAQLVDKINDNESIGYLECKVLGGKEGGIVLNDRDCISARWIDGPCFVSFDGKEATDSSAVTIGGKDYTYMTDEGIEYDEKSNSYKAKGNDGKMYDIQVGAPQKIFFNDKKPEHRKILAQQAMVMILQKIYDIKSDPDRFPGGLAENKITVFAKDEVHLKFLLAAIELTKGLFPGEINDSNFVYDSSTQKIKNKLKENNDEPSVEHGTVEHGIFWDSSKKYSDKPPYFNYEDSSRQAKLVKELVEHFGYSKTSEDYFANNIKNIQDIMKNAQGLDANKKSAYEMFGALSRKISSNPVDSDKNIELIEIKTNAI